jgi:predicted  nucleic acid-binding Zn-ribbon protein
MKGKNINQALQAMSERVNNLESASGGQRARVIQQVAKAAEAGKQIAAVEFMVKSTGNAEAIKEQTKARVNDGAGL